MHRGPVIATSGATVRLTRIDGFTPIDGSSAVSRSAPVRLSRKSDPPGADTCGRSGAEVVLAIPVGEPTDRLRGPVPHFGGTIGTATMGPDHARCVPHVPKQIDDYGRICRWNSVRAGPWPRRKPAGPQTGRSVAPVPVAAVVAAVPVVPRLVPVPTTLTGGELSGECLHRCPPQLS